MTNFEYYYNNVPEYGLCRNNLIYTSLISNDKKVFCQWYHNDTEYHRGKNLVVDPTLMDYKWNREIKFLELLNKTHPDIIPEILDIDYKSKKIFLAIDGVDFWEAAGCINDNYDHLLPNWQSQMLNIFQIYHDLKIYKYSLHPSSYFIVNGVLKSINYFFTYDEYDDDITLRSVMSHISTERQKDLFVKMEKMEVNIDQPTPHKKIQHLAFESFKTNFPHDLMEKAKRIYV